MKVTRSADLPTEHASFFPILVILFDKRVLEYVYANNPSNVPDHKKEQTYTYFKFNLQNTSNFGLSLTCYKYKGWFSPTPILQL